MAAPRNLNTHLPILPNENATPTSPNFAPKEYSRTMMCKIEVAAYFLSSTSSMLDHTLRQSLFAHIKRPDIDPEKVEAYIRARIGHGPGKTKLAGDDLKYRSLVDAIESFLTTTGRTRQVASTGGSRYQTTSQATSTILFSVGYGMTLNGEQVQDWKLTIRTMEGTMIKLVEHMSTAVDHSRLNETVRSMKWWESKLRAKIDELCLTGRE